MEEQTTKVSELTLLFNKKSIKLILMLFFERLIRYY